MPLLFKNADNPEKPKAPGEVKGLMCAEPGCNGKLVLIWSFKLSRFFYGCERYPQCIGTLPAHNNGAPKGEPRTKELQGWRKKTHQVFDVMWKTKTCKRGHAYRWLQHVMGMNSKEAHIGNFTVEQCQKVIQLVKEKGPGTKYWSQWTRRHVS
jgi:hypothetical protein